MATLKDLQIKIQQMIDAQGETAPIAYSLWQSGDVRCEVDEMGCRVLTDDEVADVLESVMKYGSSDGINYETIRDAITFKVHK